MSYLRLFCLLIFGLAGLTSRAQSTNAIACSEASLRSALEAGGFYQLECGSNVFSITITNPFVVGRDISLVSTGQLVIDGNNLTRLFVVRPGVKLTLRGFQLFEGRQTETNFNDGGIPDTSGAGIYNDGGIVTILDGRFEGHQVVGVGGRDAEASSGDNGEDGGDAAGAAIFNNGGQLFISNTVFHANTAAAGSGGDGAAGRSNGGNGGNGGSAAGAAIYSSGGRVVVYTSTFTTNAAVGSIAGVAGAGTALLGFPGQPGEAGDGVGGAIAGANAEIIIYASSFLTNGVVAGGGLAGNNGVHRYPGERGQDGGEAAGGAVYSTGALTITNSTFAANSVVSGAGGVGGNANDNGFGNDGGRGGNGGTASGGAVESAGPSTIVNCTFSDNTLAGGAGGAGGTGVGVGDNGESGNTGPTLGGAINASAGEAALANSILANSTITLHGNISDRGGNISTDLNALLTNNNSFRNVSPGLRALANNGGPTRTMAISSNSFAADRALAEFCPQVDQRGSPRVAPCDIGAFEFQPGLGSTNVLSSFSASLGTNLMVLRWPAGYVNLSVQTTANLGRTNVQWSAATEVPTVLGTNSVVTIDTTRTNRTRAFFRLTGTLEVTNTFTNFPPFPSFP